MKGNLSKGAYVAVRLFELLSGAGIDCPEHIEDVKITSIETDSRKVRAGSMFVCINGFNSDGHNYIKDAVDAGASVVVTEIGRDECVGGAAAVKVLNTRRASAFLYNSWHGDPASKLKIIGITGTNGKTSVACILRDIFIKSGKRCGYIGTVGCYSLFTKIEYGDKESLANMTTPDPAELYALMARMVDDGVEYLFLEATSHASALSKLDPIFFDTLVFTNLTRDHLDFHGSMEEYFSSKAALFSRCRTAVVNADDKYAARIIKGSKAERNILCSCKNQNCNVYASNICLGGGDGFRMKVKTEMTEFDAEIPLVGRFSPINSLEAIAVAECYGIAKGELLQILKGVNSVSGRMERVDIDKRADFSVYIDYAHTPDALENILLSARDLVLGERLEDTVKNRGRVIVLFGCGGDRDRGKRREMGAIASRLADFVIVTSDNCRSEEPSSIIEDVYKGINKEKQHIIIVERESAIRFAVSIASKGDVLILAGKGHEKYDISSRGREFFDESEIVKDAVAKRFA